MKKIVLFIGLVLLAAVTGCNQIEGKREKDGSITFEPGRFEPWTDEYEDGITITIEPVQ